MPHRRSRPELVPEPPPDRSTLPARLARLHGEPPARSRVRRRRWLIPFIAISVLLHGGLVLLLLDVTPPPPLERTEAAAESPMEFELAPEPTVMPDATSPAPAPAPPPAVPPPEPAPQPQPEPQPPLPEPPVPPRPEVPPVPPPPPPPPPPPLPPPTPEPAPLPPPPVPPPPAPPPPPQPPQPPQPPPVRPAPPAPPPPPRPRPPAPVQRAEPRPQPVPPNADFFMPPSPRTVQRNGRGPLNTSIGPADQYKADPPHRNPRDVAADVQVSGAQVGPDWEQGLIEHWLRHRYYPDAAAIRGEEGDVGLLLKVDRTGRVTALSITSSSGSYLLDAAALSTWRNARLPPFPYNTPEGSADVRIALHYFLIR